MRINCFKPVALFTIIIYCFLASNVFAASVSPALQKAKQNAESKGYIFATSKEEIIAMAKKEGKLSGMASMETETINAMRDAFKAEYPFLDVNLEESTGSEANRRFLMELKAGRDTGWDVTHMATDEYGNFLPYMKKIDILGMAEQKVLQIPAKAVEPVNRNIIAVTSNGQVVAYNKKLISPDTIPNTWDGFLKPEFKGRKFIADIRPTEFAALVPAWGLEKTMDWAHKLAAQQPIWVRGATRILVSVVAGEYALFLGPGVHTVMRTQAKDPTNSVGFKVVEPVQIRLTEATGILNAAKHPYAALLWLDFMMSPKAQAIADKTEPHCASIYSHNSALAQMTKGKKVSLVDWAQFPKMAGYQAKIVEAYGFPKAEIKK